MRFPEVTVSLPLDEAQFNETVRLIAMVALPAPTERTAAYYEGYVQGVLTTVRERRAALEAIPHDAELDLAHEEGQIHALLFVECLLAPLVEGTAST